MHMIQGWFSLRSHFRGAVALFAVCCLMIGGCSRNAGDATPVVGQLTVDGKPASAAVVTFHPVSATNPDAPRPTGRVDSEGRFQLTSSAAGDGAPPGDYKVTVTWRVAVPGKRVSESDEIPV